MAENQQEKKNAKGDLTLITC